jgi:hypothetical protein
VCCDSGKRLRRRGPRSQMARLRRSVPKSHRTLPGISLGESRDTIPVSFLNSPCEAKAASNISSVCTLEDRNSSLCLNGIFVYNVNIRCILAHLTELQYHVDLHRPHIVMIQETWLDASVEDVQLFNYEKVSRRDRKETANRGGIMTFRRSDFNALTHIKDCDDEERSWHFLNLGIETFLIANWYRPGDSPHDGFISLHAETSEYFQQCTGILIAGDLNIHHKKWLRFSNDNSVVGTDMKSFCDFYGMTQLVREPTRKEYLLDLACCNIHNSSVTVHPCIADHKALLIKLPLPVMLEQTEQRDVWILKEAKWEALKKDISDYNWHSLGDGTAEDALNVFLEVL